MVKNIEASYSGECLQNYLEYVDELPVDISRMASKLRELDVKCKGYLDEADNLNRQKESLADETEKSFAARETKRLLEKIVQALKNFQDSVDEKIRFTHQMSESIDLRNRSLDSDFSNLGLVKKDEPLADISNIKQEREHQVASPVNVASQQSFATSPTKASSGDNGNNAPTSGSGSSNANNKRARRARTDTVSMDIDEIPIKIESPPIITKPAAQSAPTTSTAQKKAAASGGAGGKKKKRKAGRQSNAQATTNNQITLREQVTDALPIDPEAIDPEEPTYCLCEQISFGEMILCDNDLCPIEWFHFSCVSLMTKPKGKWFCPNCRGDRVNCMKPKAQFLKELRKYEMRQEI